MITIWAETTVSAAHTFNGHMLHGHTYLVRVYVYPPADAERLHADLLDTRKAVDHTCLNDVLPDPTMEALGQWFLDAMAPRYRMAEVAITRPEGMGCRVLAPADPAITQAA
ncbi:MAG: 6-pyruvoyl trahydropterin synthase family protein [Janthinobacterium lividum]